MNPPSFVKFAPRVAHGGLLIVNASLIDLDDVGAPPGVTLLPLPCTELAAGAGDDTLVSVVALGALVERLGWVSPEAVRRTIREVVGVKRPQVVEADLRALEAGREAAAPIPAA
jgi:2-oxoglutarate ferredoxin oxidoreductase subunit gamma